MRKSLRAAAILAGAGLALSSQSPRARADALTDAEAAYVQQGFGMFIHFNMPTFVNDTATHNQPNIDVFNPYALNTDQWAATAKAAGMKYVVLTAKHVDGFALWDTPESTYNAANTTWGKAQAPGQADVIARLQASCDKYGVKLGLYFNMADFTNGIYPQGSTRTTGLNNPHDDAYNLQYDVSQIKELVTRYPEIQSVWCDTYGWGLQGPGLYGVDQVDAAIKTGNPGRLTIINGAGSDVSNIVTYEREPVPTGNTTPAEECTTIGSGWFYGAYGEQSNYTPQQIADTVRATNANDGNYLLDVQVDRSGNIYQPQVNTLVQTGQLLGVTNAPVVPSKPTRPAAGTPSSLGNGAFAPNTSGAGNGNVGGGWTQHGHVTLTDASTVTQQAYASTPSSYVEFSPDTVAGARVASGELSQAFATVPGQQYTVFFQEGVDATNTGNAGLLVSATGGPALQYWIQNEVYKNGDPAGTRVVNWQPDDESYTFTATSTLTTLDFQDITDYSGPPASGLDYTSAVLGVVVGNVAIAPTPEPTSLAFVAVGAGFALRRRRARSTSPER